MRQRALGLLTVAALVVAACSAAPATSPPSVAHTAAPTAAHAAAPTAAPIPAPTAPPTAAPTEAPNVAPTEAPTSPPAGGGTFIVPPVEPDPARTTSGTTSGVTYVYFDDMPVGVLAGNEGCTLVGVVKAQPGGNFETKEVSGAELERCEVTLRFGMSRDMKQWIQSQLGGKNEAKRLSLVRVSLNGTPVAALTLEDANLTGLALERLDASLQTPLTVALELTASTSLRPPASDFAAASTFTDPRLLASNYRVSVEGVTGGIGVAGISPLRLERGLDAGRFGPWVVDDLSLNVARSQAATWDKWYQAVVVDGRDDQRQVTLEFLTFDLSAVGATFTLGGVGVIGADGNIGTSEGARRKFRAYVQTVEVQIP